MSFKDGETRRRYDREYRSRRRDKVRAGFRRWYRKRSASPDGRAAFASKARKYSRTPKGRAYYHDYARRPEVMERRRRRVRRTGEARERQRRLRATPEGREYLRKRWVAWSRSDAGREYLRNWRNEPTRKERSRAAMRAWHERHPGYEREWRAAHPERARRAAWAYGQRHPDRVKAAAARNYARRRGATPAEKIPREAIWIRDRGLCGDCGVFCPFDGGWHMDHIVPIVKGGGHTWGNVRVTCPPCNLRKHDKLPPSPD
jgi:5-methylcytosine-specific restriction endonuclease McrA